MDEATRGLSVVVYLCCLKWTFIDAKISSAISKHLSFILASSLQVVSSRRKLWRGCCSLSSCCLFAGKEAGLVARDVRQLLSSHE